MSDFSALHVALSGLQAAQLGIDTTSHNISNSATDGYTRQRVELAARFSRSLPYGQLGLGVEIVDITRARDVFLDNRFRTDAEAFSASGVRADLLSKAERILGEPESGLSGEMSALWSSFEDLAISPQDTAARQGVVSQLEATAVRVRSIAEGLDALASTEAFSLSTTIEDANELLHQVADLNQAILDAGTAGGSPNDLMDQRDVLLDDLSSKLGVKVIPQGDGSVRVSLNGMALVSETNVSELSFDNATFSVLHPTGVELAVGGEARGFQSFLQDDLVGLRADLDAFVVEFADNVNSVHSAGWVSSTEMGGDLFVYDATDPAKTLSAAVTDPARLATATTSGPPFPAFDGGNADALAALRTSLVAGGGTETIEGAFRSIVTDLGQATATAHSGARSQASLLASSDRARMSTHGVSLDEEMVSMLEYQRMYEAAARVMTAIDEALDVLINRTGVVGR